MIMSNDTIKHKNGDSLCKSTANGLSMTIYLELTVTCLHVLENMTKILPVPFMKQLFHKPGFVYSMEIRALMKLKSHGSRMPRP